MTPGEYQHLVEFLAVQFDRVWKELARIDQRFESQREETRTLVLVTAESLRDEIRLVAEGVATNRQLIGEVRTDVRTLRRDVEHLDTKVTVRLDDHEMRIRRLE
ncbi:MAG: hypothetical protein PVI57_16915 [Gemmatimonadota bacterium]